jgi:iron-sulfur cluster repair protein YtfE (RIC family)
LDFNRHISRRLHEEHAATLALWGRVEQSFLAGKSDPALLNQAAAALADEVSRHFDFEERELFPRLKQAGEGDIAELLAEEHVAIRAAARSFIESKEKTVALELAERLVSHIQKEEMSLLPALEDLLDEDTDRELTAAYAAG